MSDTIFGGPWIMKARLDQNIWVGSQSLLHQLGFEPATRRNEINMLGTREGSTGVAFPPPLTLAETDDGPLRGPFFFLFQRGLAVATALRRLEKYPKSVSEPALSLTERPRCSEGRIQKV